jgi:hypothetical protein
LTHEAHRSLQGRVRGVKGGAAKRAIRVALSPSIGYVRSEG